MARRRAPEPNLRAGAVEKECIAVYALPRQRPPRGRCPVPQALVVCRLGSGPQRPKEQPTCHTIHRPPFWRSSGASGPGTMCRVFRRPVRRAATAFGAGSAAAGRIGSAAASAARSATIRATCRSIMRSLRHSRALCIARRPGRRGQFIRDAGRSRNRLRRGAARGER
jgi:hypothetical protein